VIRRKAALSVNRDLFNSCSDPRRECRAAQATAKAAVAVDRCPRCDGQVQ
jgi:hypothetical protein